MICDDAKVKIFSMVSHFRNPIGKEAWRKLVIYRIEVVKVLMTPTITILYIARYCSRILLETENYSRYIVHSLCIGI